MDGCRPVARIFFGGVRSLERKGYFCQDFFFWGGGCVVWRGRGIFARIFFFGGGGVRSLERKGYFCQRFSVAVKSIYNQLGHDNSLLL